MHSQLHKSTDPASGSVTDGLCRALVAREYETPNIIVLMNCHSLNNNMYLTSVIVAFGCRHLILLTFGYRYMFM